MGRIATVIPCPEILWGTGIYNPKPLHGFPHGPPGVEGNAECEPSLEDLTLPLVEGGGGSRAGGGKCGRLEAQRVESGLPRTHTRKVGKQQEASLHIS